MSSTRFLRAKGRVEVGIILGELGVARTVLPVTEDRSVVIKSIRRWYRREAANPEGVVRTFRAARSALGSAADRLGPDDHPNSIREVVIFIGGLPTTRTCGTLVREVEQLKKASVLVMTAAPGRTSSSYCHYVVATSPRYVFIDSWWLQIRQVFEPIRHSFGSDGHLVRRIDVETVIGPDFTYVEDSAEPPLSQQNGGRLLWTVDPAPRSRSSSNPTFSYRLRSKRDSAGNTPIATQTNVSVWSRIDYPNYVVHRSVPSPYLLVLEPRSWPDLGWPRSAGAER